MGDTWAIDTWVVAEGVPRLATGLMGRMAWGRWLVRRAAWARVARLVGDLGAALWCRLCCYLPGMGFETWRPESA